MAEVVESRIEEMLSELEQMERVGLFNSSEIRQIMGKRKVYEYKLRRKKKEKEDFLQYIQYETNLLALVRKRRERTGYNFKKLEIDNAITVRIHKLFRLVLHRFPEDIKLWLTYIAFAKQMKSKTAVSRQYTRMLQVHDKKPELWLSAAKWEFEENNNPDNTRSFLQRALRFNNTSKKLWIEYYRMELLFAEKMRKRQEILGDTIAKEDEVNDNILNGRVALLVYQQAREAIPDDVDFLVSFLPVSQLFAFTRDHEQEIFKELKEQYGDKPQTWAAMANNHLARCGNTRKDREEVEKKFHKVYEQAITIVSTGEIWELYINSCLQLVEDAQKKSQRAKRLQRALLVFEEAQEAGHLTADLYKKWIDVLCNTGWPNEALEVSKSAVEAHTGSVKLWMKKLELMITTRKSLKEIQETLKQAQNLIPKKESWPLVQLVLDLSISEKSADTTVRLLETSMIEVADVSRPAKELYLEYEYLQHGIEHARKIYDRICEYKPVSCEFYQSYISMELAQANPKMKIIRAVYEEAVREHGTSYPDLWLDYIKLESSGVKGKPEKVGNIHFRAVKALEGKNNQEFIRKYTLLQTCAS